MPLDRDLSRLCAAALQGLGAPPAAADLAVVAWLDFLRIDPTLPDDGSGDRLLVGGSRSAQLCDAVRRIAGARPGTGGISSWSGDGVFGAAVGMAWGTQGSRVVAIAPLAEVFAGAPVQTAAFAVRAQLGDLVVLAADDGTDDQADEATDQLAQAGWLVQSVAAHDPLQIAAALKRARGRNRPSLIVGRSATRVAAAVDGATIPDEVEAAFAARAMEVREWRRALREAEAAASVFGGGDDTPAPMPFRPCPATTPTRLAMEMLAVSGRTVECPPVGSREEASLALGLALLGRTPVVAAPLDRADDLRPFLRQAARAGLSGVALLLDSAEEDETLWSLRLIPGLTVWRPADGLEIAAACAAARDARGPHVIAIPAGLRGAIARPRPPAPGDVERGAYVVADTSDALVVLLAGGGELPAALHARTELEARGLATRVVSVPCVGRLAAWPAAQLRRFLGESVIRVVLEPGPELPWRAVLGGEIVMAGTDVAERVTGRLRLELPRREAVAVRT